MRPRPLRYLSSLALLLVAGLAVASPRPVALADLYPVPEQTKSAVVINQVLERYHYRKLSLDPAFARAVLVNYLDALDPSKSFFLARDVRRFEDGGRRLDERLRRGELDTAFDIFRLYRMRVDDRVDYALQLLQGEFDFSRDEHYALEPAEDAWAEDGAALDERWRKRVKNDFLVLRLADRSDEDIRERLRKRYEGLARRIEQFDRDDVFQTFMNAYTLALEPHTSYMSPSTSENFDISMKLSLEGIGAVLRADNEYTVVQSTVPGGPARESGQVHTGDQIVGVGQGLDGPFEDVVGWRLEDVVEKIRGPKGSVVRLQLLSKGAGVSARTREVALVRNEIKLEDQAAKSYVIDDLESAAGVRVGVIEIPAFYRDFQAEGEGRRDFRSTTRDVRALIDDLVMQGVNGLLIDLRANGGGSLAEATALTGLFIDTGPVVQVKDAFGRVEVESDPEPGVLYTGPLAVLVDRDSASASEIFAAAIQDHGRGWVIGEPTFGKGTVQTLIDLNRYVPGEQTDLGRLRLTMAEFFRISGGSTQLRGVEPDIRFPTADTVIDHGERALDNPLPWTRISPATYRHLDMAGDVETLIDRSQARIADDPGFRMLTERGKLLAEMKERTLVSLNERARRAEDERLESAFKAHQDRFLRAHGITPVDEDADPIDEEALEAQREAISRIQVEEAARILADAIVLGRQAPPRAAMTH
ncbi:carboxy terminal-processing peptidase [Marichromatium bheemlicum]|uniref:Carboxy terminal-processing peptidase n=1 Tax=Marichromatium bheemlicum TaxID=365339 RepID=A0ABX1IAB6_9GAMM|nr:carboxy terminal-processing peptidase [Marichromatium bheemlicum]NKN33949.1 carboxy terminal-processing peptidase [Marichromatium bheemlicum]